MLEVVYPGFLQNVSYHWRGEQILGSLSSQKILWLLTSTQYSCHGGTNAFLLEADFLKTPLAEVFVGCLKAEPCAAQGYPWQSGCCSTAHPSEGLVGSCRCPGDIHRAPSLPFCHSRSCAGGRNDSHSDHSMHSPGLLIASLPKGQLGAFPLLLLFSPFPGEHSCFFLQLT